VLVSLGDRSVPTSGHRSERSYAALSTRRAWSPSEKRAIVSESSTPGASVSAVARRHGVAQSLLYRWRKDAAVGAGTAPAFVPVSIAALPQPGRALSPAAAAIIAALEGPSETGA
jgi:transposase